MSTNNLLSEDMDRQHLKFPTKRENITLVEKLIDQVCDEYKIGESNYGNMLVAVTEAVYNAMNHGNKFNSQKNVDVIFEENNSKLVFTIKDEGAGFDPDKLPDPTSPENLEKENGRGVFLMKHLADEIEFSDEGRLVKMSFNFSRN